MPAPIATQIVTADAVVGLSGKPTTVYGVLVTSDGTSGVVILRNGTGTGDTAFETVTGAINVVTRVDYGTHGLFFPNGCFCDVNANALTTTVRFTTN